MLSSLVMQHKVPVASDPPDSPPEAPPRCIPSARSPRGPTDDAGRPGPPPRLGWGALSGARAGAQGRSSHGEGRPWPRYAVTRGRLETWRN